MATRSNEEQTPRRGQRTNKTDSTSLKSPEKPGRDVQRTEEDDFTTEDELIPSNPYPRLSSSAIRRNPTGIQRATGPQNSPIPQRSGLQRPTTSAQPTPIIPNPRATTRQQPPPIYKEARKVHWLLYIGIGMLAMLVLWVVGSTVLAWGTARYEDYRYGNPRTFQTDAVVGHGDSPAHPSHFIAVNLHGQVIVVEFPAGSPAKSISYLGPLLVETNSDLIPVTLEFRDVNGDKKPDMLIHIADKVFVFINDGTQFRPSDINDPLK